MPYAETKEQKRERFKANDDGEMVVIPAKAIYTNGPLIDRKLRVAAYCRVSTPDEAQTSSFEIQRNYYEKYIRDQENWIYAGIFADEGISGTNRKKRDQFNLMINDCVEGKIDLIITKSVSRFSRNVVDCLSVVRQLGNLTPRVGVLFQTENINTFQKDSEIFLTMDMDWIPDNRYKVQAVYQKIDHVELLVFNLEECEMIVPQYSDGADGKRVRKVRRYYPDAWKESFGMTYREHKQSIAVDIDAHYMG